MRKRETSEKLVKTMLLESNLDPEKIKVSHKKTPDFLVRLGKEVALIEVKERQDDLLAQAEISQELKEKSEVARSIPIKYATSMAGKLEQASRQLGSCEVGGALRIAWLVYRGKSPEVESKLLHKTLFGGQDFITEKSETLGYCFFYNESTFYSQRANIDAVIETTQDESRITSRLHLNPLSGRFSLALNSTILKSIGFSPRNPIDKDNPDLMVLDATMPRKDTVAKIAYLKEKYGHKTLEEFSRSVISVTMSFRINDLLPANSEGDSNSH